MHDVSGSGGIAFVLTVSGWQGEYTSPDARWFPVGNLPTNMLDRSRVALRNYAEGMRFSTYPAFGPAGPALFQRDALAGRLQRLTSRTGCARIGWQRWPRS